MGQQFSASRTSGDCTCGCGGEGWDARRALVLTPPPAPPAPPELYRRTDEGGGGETARQGVTKSSSVDRYVSALTERSTPNNGASPDCRYRSRRPLLAWLRGRARPVNVGAAPQPRSSAESGIPSVVAAPSNGMRCNNCREDRLPAVLALDARELRRELDALASLHANAERVDGGEGIDAAVGGGSTGDLFLVSVAPHSELARVEAEDCEESARERRALEIAQGVEPPPGFRPHCVQVVCRGDIRALLLRAPPVLAPPAPPAPPPETPPTKVHTQVDYIHCLVPDLRAITACCFYWGKMDRYEAERLLDNKPEGTFLLRDSAQEEHLFSVSFRKYGRSLHARIEHFNHRFSFDSHDPAVFAARTVTGLIEHYKDPACVMFFEPMLTAPLARTAPFGLQQLARAAVVSSTTYDGIDELPLPSSLKAYLKEYHYRQRVRVKRFDNAPQMATAI